MPSGFAFFDLLCVMAIDAISFLPRRFGCRPAFFYQHRKIYVFHSDANNKAAGAPFYSDGKSGTLTSAARQHDGSKEAL